MVLPLLLVVLNFFMHHICGSNKNSMNIKNGKQFVVKVVQKSLPRRSDMIAIVLSSFDPFAHKTHHLVSRRSLLEEEFNYRPIIVFPRNQQPTDTVN